MFSTVTDINRLGESLLICNRSAEEILTGLYNIKHLLQPEQYNFIDSVVGDGTNRTQTPKSSWPRIFSDQSMQVLLKTFLRRYPEHPASEISKLPIYYAFATDAKGIADELQPFYKIIWDTYKFSESAQSILLLCEKLCENIAHCQNNFLLIDQIFTLLLNYLSVQILLSGLDASKRAVISIYAYLQPGEIALQGGNQLSRYQRLVNFLDQNEKFLQNIHDNLTPISAFIAHSLSSLIDEYEKHGFASVEVLRKDFQLNFLAGTTSVGAIADFDYKLKILSLVNKLPLYTVVAFICCPAELVKRTECLNAFKAAVSQTSNFVLFRSEMLDVFNMCDLIGKSNAKYAKIFKSIVADGLGASLYQSSQLHHNRRDYLRFILRQLSLALTDQPSLLAHKIFEVEALLLMAKEEIMWYFAHHEKVLSVAVTKNSLPVADPSITELIELVYDLRAVIVSHYDSIKQHNIDVIQNILSQKVSVLVSNITQNGTTAEVVSSCLSNMLGELQSNEANFEALRINYMRILVHFGKTNESKSDDIAEFTKTMNTVCHRSHFIDQCPTNSYFDQLCSLKFLFYYRPIMQSIFEEIMRQQPNQMRFVSIYGSLAKDFLKNAISYFPKEFERIAERSCLFAEDYLRELSQSASQYLYNIAIYKTQLSRQMTGPNAIIFVPNRRDKKKKIDDYQMMRPGNESELANLPTLGPLPILIMALANSMHSLVKFSKIEIFDTVYFPKQFFREAVTTKFKTFLTQALVNQEVKGASSPKEVPDDFMSAVKRPSLFLKELEGYIAVVSSFDNALGIELLDIIQTSISEQVDFLRVRHQLDECIALKNKTIARGKRPAAADNSYMPSINSYMGIYCHFYTEFCREKMCSLLILFSELRKSTFNTAQVGSKSNIIAFVDSVGISSDKLLSRCLNRITEFSSLCRLIGPTGIEFIGDRLFSMNETAIKDVFELISANSETLQMLQRINDLKPDKLKQLMDLAQKLREIGFVMQFRKNLIDFGSIALNTKIVDKNNCETRLLHKEKASEAVKSLIPISFAFLLRLTANDEKNCYSTALDAFENGSDFLVCGMQTILNFIGLDMSLHERVLMNRDFLMVGSIFLMKTKEGHKEQHRSAFLLLSKICEIVAPLNSDSLEEFVPYSLLRSIYEDAFCKGRINQVHLKTENMEV